MKNKLALTFNFMSQFNKKNNNKIFLSIMSHKNIKFCLPLKG